MKKIIPILIFIILLFGTWQNCQAQQRLILNYPPLETDEGTFSLGPDTPLPEFIRYIFIFALGLVGFIALLAIMIGAVLYVTSAGNPSKMGDAKDRIMSALLGILILLASVLLLRTISPDLVNIGVELPIIEPGNGGGGGSGPNRACLCWYAGDYSLQNCYSTSSECTNNCNAFCVGREYERGSCHTYGTCE